MPKVSIIVPCYNHARYLERRLESVYGQTFRDCEVILLDDCSPDASREVMEKFPKTLPTRCVFNEVNSGGPFAQWVKGLGLATGELVWIAESDDVCEPTFLERLVRELDADPKLSLVFCQSRVIDREGCDQGVYTETVDPRHADRYRADFRNDGIDECSRFMVQQNFIPNGSAVLFRRSLAGGIEPMLATMRYMGDWVLYMHLLTQGDLKFVAEPLNSYRLHLANQSRSTAALIASFQERLRGVKWLGTRIALSPRSLGRGADEIVFHCYYLYRCLTPVPVWEVPGRLASIRREGGVPWTVLIPAMLRFAGRRLAYRLRCAFRR